MQELTHSVDEFRFVVTPATKLGQPQQQQTSRTSVQHQSANNVREFLPCASSCC